MRRPSQLKERVAQKIRDAFSAGDVNCLVFPGDFITADGYWRRADVYRWTIRVQLASKETNGQFRSAVICSYATLTDCARHKLDIKGSYHPWEYEADIISKTEISALNPSPEGDSNG